MILKRITLKEARDLLDKEVMDWLALCPMSMAQLVAAMKMPKSTLYMCVERLYDNRQIHVAGKTPQGGRIYSAGDREDCVTPFVVEDDFENGRRKPVEVIVHRDPLHAALFGEYRRAA